MKKKHNDSKQQKLVMIAAGGTGGHIFPAQAFVETLQKITNYRLVLLGDKRILPLNGALKKIEFHRISAEGISGRSRLGFLLAITILAIGFLQSLYLLRKTRPAVVIGFGGYAALPPMLAANITRVPTVLHEQNAVLGRANRLLLPGADRVALSFRQTRFIEGSISKGLAVWTGNPVRSSFQRLTQKSYQTINSKNDTIRLLVLGGSQGARVFGSCVPQAIALLPQNLRERIQLCQQVRKDQIQSVRQFYKRYRIKAQTNHFFADIAARMDAAHLIVCRAGATTLAEIVTVGRPAVLIPYPHAIDDHQRENALRIVRAGAGWMIPEDTLTPEILSRKIAGLLEHNEFLTIAAKCARKLAHKNAEKKLVAVVRDLVDNENKASKGQILA